MHKRTAIEKEKIILDIQEIGVVAGCRKYGISNNLYYTWLDKYNASGLEGLEPCSNNKSAIIKRLESENRILKEILAEKDLELKMKDGLLKKKIAQWNKEKK